MPGGRRPNASIVSSAASRVHAINLFGDWDYHGGECPSTRSNVRDRELKVHESGIRVREGGGCLLVIGLPFIALGLVFFAGGTGLVPFDNADEVPLWALVVTAVMGAIAILTGVVLVFERRVVEIDTRLGQVRRERRLFFPLLRNNGHLPSSTRFSCARETTPRPPTGRRSARWRCAAARGEGMR